MVNHKVAPPAQTNTGARGEMEIYFQIVSKQ